MRRKAFVSVLFSILFFNIMLGSDGWIHHDADTLRIVIPFNNCVADSKLAAGPGFSAWIVFKDRIIMFDAGSDYRILLENMIQLDLDFTRATDIFISHNHWDHVFGVVGIAGIRYFKINAFVPAFSAGPLRQQVPRLQITEISECKAAYPGIWTSGEMQVEYLNTVISEQSLIVEAEKQLVIITGWSHPGVETIINLVRTKFPKKEIALLLGGFHLEVKTPEEIRVISDYLKESGVRAIAPSHCTADAAIRIFRDEWGDHFIRMSLGDEYLMKF